MASAPKGLLYQDNFISEEYHQDLVTFIDSQGTWDRSLARRTQHYGYRYDYANKNAATKAAPIPPEFEALRELVKPFFRGVLPDQIIVNEYLPGQGIAAHIDHKFYFGDTIVSVSLLSLVDMVLKNGGKTHTQILQPRSALILQDEARYMWTHEIPRRRFSDPEQKYPRGRRLSITLRKMRHA